jgi:hypothetical protein
MLAVIKIIHLLCLFGGGASSIGNGLLLREVMAGSGPPPPAVARTMKTLAFIGLGAIVLLWVTGLMLVVLGPGFGAFGWAFWVKLLAATLVLFSVSMINYLGAKARKAGRGPDPARIKPLSIAASVGAAAAVVFAVIAFR